MWYSRPLLVQLIDRSIRVFPTVVQAFLSKVVTLSEAQSKQLREVALDANVDAGNDVDWEGLRSALRVRPACLGGFISVG